MVSKYISLILASLFVIILSFCFVSAAEGLLGQTIGEICENSYIPSESFIDGEGIEVAHCVNKELAEINNLYVIDSLLITGDCSGWDEEAGSFDDMDGILHSVCYNTDLLEDETQFFVSDVKMELGGCTGEGYYEKGSFVANESATYYYCVKGVNIDGVSGVPGTGFGEMETHLECVSKVCTEVEGAGVNECLNDGDCGNTLEELTPDMDTSEEVCQITSYPTDLFDPSTGSELCDANIPGARCKAPVTCTGLGQLLPWNWIPCTFSTGCEDSFGAVDLIVECCTGDAPEKKTDCMREIVSTDFFNQKTGRQICADRGEGLACSNLEKPACEGFGQLLPNNWGPCSNSDCDTIFGGVDLAVTCCSSDASPGENCAYVKDAIGDKIRVNSFCERIDLSAGNCVEGEAEIWSPEFLECATLPENRETVSCDYEYDDDLTDGDFYRCARVKCCGESPLPAIDITCENKEYTEELTITEYREPCEYFKNAIGDGIRVDSFCEAGKQCQSAEVWDPTFFECATLPENRETVSCDYEYDDDLTDGEIYRCARAYCCEISEDDPAQIKAKIGFDVSLDGFFVQIGQRDIGVASFKDNEYRFDYGGKKYSFSAKFNKPGSESPLDKLCEIDVL